MSVPTRFKIVGAKVENIEGTSNDRFSLYGLNVGNTTDNWVVSFAVERDEFILLMLALGAKKPDELIGKEFEAIHCADATDAVNQVAVKQLHALHGRDYVPPAPGANNRVSSAVLDKVYDQMACAIGTKQSAPDLSLFERRVVFDAVQPVINHATLDEQWVKDFLKRVNMYSPDGIDLKRKAHGQFYEFPCRQLEFVMTRGPWYKRETWYVAIIPDGGDPVQIKKV